MLRYPANDPLPQVHARRIRRNILTVEVHGCAHQFALVTVTPQPYGTSLRHHDLGNGLHQLRDDLFQIERRGEQMRQPGQQQQVAIVLAKRFERHLGSAAAALFLK